MMHRALACLTVALLLAGCQRSFHSMYSMPSEAMEPALKKGSMFRVDRLAYDGNEPRRWDVIVFQDPEKRRLWAFRVVGLPGETVEFQSDALVVDGRALAPPMGLKYSPAVDDEAIALPLTVPEDQYFVLGDNPAAARDSRFLGTVPLDAILGRAIGR